MKRVYISHLKWSNLLLIGVLTLVSFSLRPAIIQPEPTVKLTKIGFIGDSITRGPQKGKSPVDHEIESLGDSFVGVNEAVNGTTTADWRPGAPLFDEALAKFRAQNVHIVSIMLGTNDARRDRAISPATYRRDMDRIVGALLSSGVVNRVIINYPPYFVPGPDRWNGISIALLKLYMHQLDAITEKRGVAKGDMAAFNYFRRHTDRLIDGVHPDDRGREVLGRMWADAYERVVAQEVSRRQLSVFTSVPSDRI